MERIPLFSISFLCKGTTYVFTFGDNRSVFFLFAFLTSGLIISLKIASTIFCITRKKYLMAMNKKTGKSLFSQPLDLRGGENDGLLVTADNLSDCIKPGRIYELIHQAVKKTFFNEFLGLKLIILRTMKFRKSPLLITGKGFLLAYLSWSSMTLYPNQNLIRVISTHIMDPKKFLQSSLAGTGIALLLFNTVLKFSPIFLGSVLTPIASLIIYLQYASIFFSGMLIPYPAVNCGLFLKEISSIQQVVERPMCTETTESEKTCVFGPPNLFDDQHITQKETWGLLDNVRDASKTYVSNDEIVKIFIPKISEKKSSESEIRKCVSTGLNSIECSVKTITEANIEYKQIHHKDLSIHEKRKNRMRAAEIELKLDTSGLIKHNKMSLDNRDQDIMDQRETDNLLRKQELRKQKIQVDDQDS